MLHTFFKQEALLVFNKEDWAISLEFWKIWNLKNKVFIFVFLPALIWIFPGILNVSASPSQGLDLGKADLRNGEFTFLSMHLYHFYY